MSVSTLNEIASWEENQTIINVAEIKLRCIELAIQTTKNGCYGAKETLDEAKNIFDWVMNNEAFEKQY
jgi:hypothetical protein